ncbi:PREDICTED: non-histone chromosomal protein HMG-14 [Lepidothrix coronata]|uniref:Non-histone chromosomal protein HMG-14 n=1 Tax=Lepidothrix coronata TaxID=321398 RepID=A0A6J0GVX4_9PASS|nr:PREDICTED: non-histone chromosomal protein HMG-14 [Lepidothrix coronata]
MPGAFPAVRGGPAGRGGGRRRREGPGGLGGTRGPGAAREGEFTHWKCISLQDKSEDKKAQKGKKGPKGKQTEETNQEQTKDNLPAENGEAKTEETPAPDAAAEKEVKSE